TLAERNHGEKCRHVIDHGASVDGRSVGNVSIQHSNAAFLLHGSLNKDVVSEGDASYSDRGVGHGWVAGNPSYTKDINYTIINPVHVGSAAAVVVWQGSENTLIVNPNFKITANDGGEKCAIAFRGASKGLTIDGGVIDCSEMTGGTLDAVIR